MAEPESEQSKAQLPLVKTINGFWCKLTNKLCVARNIPQALIHTIIVKLRLLLLLQNLLSFKFMVDLKN